MANTQLSNIVHNRLHEVNIIKFIIKEQQAENGQRRRYI